MRKNEYSKYKRKNLRKKLSCFELDEFVSEIKEYNNLLANMGIDLTEETNISNKYRSNNIDTAIDIDNNPRTNSNDKLNTESK